MTGDVLLLTCTEHKKKKRRTKIEKEASGKNGVMDVRGRMEEGMKG